MIQKESIYSPGVTSIENDREGGRGRERERDGQFCTTKFLDTVFKQELCDENKEKKQRRENEKVEDEDENEDENEEK